KKNVFQIAAAVLLVLSMAFYACDKDDDDDNGDNNNNNNNSEYLPQTLTMKVNGTEWESDPDEITGRLIGSEIYIQGANKSGTTNIQLVYDGVWMTGTYELERASFDPPNYTYTLQDPADASITFTEFTVQDSVKQDSTITGTFEALLVDQTVAGHDTVIITDGYFENIFFNR
ncbi:MAG: hypothetical protein R6U19_04205, partial [Bacteroidales bacterium]